MNKPGTGTDEALREEMRRLLRAGLPVRAQQCGPALLGLRGVKARAVDVDDRSSLAYALDGLLREQLSRFGNAELAKPARLLFGVDDSTSGTTLTSRREVAAAAAGYEVHHFRKRVEPKLVDLVIWQLRRDSEELTVETAAPPRLRPAVGRPNLPADVFAWEAAEHQHALASLWGAVYLLRAELVKVAQLVSMDATESELADAADTALWRQALVLHATRHYQSAYGSALLHAATALAPGEIATSAGWSPPLSPAQELLLSGTADPVQGRADFMTRLFAAVEGADLVVAWRRALTGRSGGLDKERERTHEH
ncbi:hypothetical protein BZB76_0969 [Actinomadura pelletieri DSM 43383]|uniref:Uncharacterized protein n=1 Tax=Actinomadura pelletieri DSM 43383 TaxID=1120940 RepID=A0A495QZ43_9ACTN|nr:hypothetical protein [Actinomadura pelletieri]RKS79499.1 hypothetical protein BZB76_0969 [Actinomadura pelletieri DSM 43383]